MSVLRLMRLSLNRALSASLRGFTIAAGRTQGKLAEGKGFSDNLKQTSYRKQ